MNGQITVIDYLERVPNGYISNQQELIQSLRERANPATPAQVQGMQGAEMSLDMPNGAGYGNLQRAINQTGMEGLDLSQIKM